MTDAGYEACRRIVRRSKSNFPLAFRLLPRNQRRGMTALYAWLRIADDVADGPEPVEAKREKFIIIRSDLTSPQRKQAPCEAALHDTIDRFQIPVRHLLDALDGVESDLIPRRFTTFSELEPYCHQVASSVGLACLCIWGVADPAAAEPARAAGLAFQLTNILRDIGEDSRNGRVYLPQDEMMRFGWQPGSRDETAFRALMQFQIARAHSYYKMSDDLRPLLPRRARSMFATMAGIYESLLNEIERHPLAVLSRRLRVHPLRKAVIFAAALLDASAKRR